MPEESLQEKTEEPTPRRREEARKRGQVAKSRELAAVAVLSGGLLSFLLAGGFIYTQLVHNMIYFLNLPYRSLELPEARDVLLVGTQFALLALFPVVVAVTMASFLSLFLQVRGVVAWEALAPKGERINPVEGFKRLFSLPSLVELLKSLLKLVLISLVAYLVIKKDEARVLLLIGEPVEDMARELFILSRTLVAKTIVALVALAILDFLFQRWETERHLRMTREELKEELKQTEGDPWVKSRIRQIQRAMAQRRMMAEVPQADVVITNPQHVAVALKYELGEMPAPQVVAKGADLLAQRIKDIAREHHVPVVENPPLARALYRVEVGEFVPAELYQAVAEVLAYVYKLKGKVN